MNPTSSVYPTPEEIISNLTELENAWRPLAIIWHIYFAAFAIAFLYGVRPSKRISGVLLALPFASVSILAWSIMNPVNGIAFALISILLIGVSVKLPQEKAQIAPLSAMIPGILMFIFGWIYPHFLDPSSSLSFLHSSPVGIIPCATLSIGIGITMILKSLGSRKTTVILGISGILYGITGVVQLGVTIDLILLLGSIVLLIFAFIKRNGK